MKVIVNLPETEEDISNLQNNVADFHATLLVHKIRDLNTNDNLKENILDTIINDIRKNV